MRTATLYVQKALTVLHFAIQNARTNGTTQTRCVKMKFIVDINVLHIVR